MEYLCDLKNEDGTTLIETLVAMAILVSVLLPVSMFLGYMAVSPQNEEKILALGMAQTEMEMLLNQGEFSDQERSVKNKWTIKNAVIRDGNIIQIEISVYRKSKPTPVVTLKTERLLYEEKE